MIVNAGLQSFRIHDFRDKCVRGLVQFYMKWLCNGSVNIVTHLALNK